MNKKILWGVATPVGANRITSKGSIRKVRWEPTVGGSELDGLPTLEIPNQDN